MDQDAQQQLRREGFGTVTLQKTTCVFFCSPISDEKVMSWSPGFPAKIQVLLPGPSDVDAVKDPWQNDESWQMMVDETGEAKLFEEIGMGSSQ